MAPSLRGTRRAALRILLSALAAGALSAPLAAQGDTTAALIRARVEGRERPSAAGEPLRSAEAVRQFYRAAGYRPGWSGPSAVLPAAAAMAGFLADQIASDGLEPNDYHARPIARLMDPRRRLGPADRAELDLLLTDAYLAAAHDLVHGRVPPRAVHPGWSLSGRTADLPATLSQALLRGRVGEALVALRPPTAQYGRLRRALAHYRQLEAQGGWATLAGRTLHPGDAGPEVLALRARLAAEGALEAGDTAVFDSVLEAAVRRFQRRNGVADDGTVGPATRAALNVTAERRVRQLRAALERERWLPASLGRRYVAVWIPACELQAVQGGRVALESRVIGGKTGWHTPIFSAPMTTVIFNPYWNIPPSILGREVLPRQRRDPSYFSREGIEAVRDGGSVRYRQVPGPRNPLGEVKLVFPNPYNVYLHDTSSPSLFARDERAFSHGCVRVEKPLELAAFALAETPGWTAEAVLAAGGGSRERPVALAEPIPVHVFYRTAWVDDDGEVQFRRDLYGLDARLERALGSGDPSRARPGREKAAEEAP